MEVADNDDQHAPLLLPPPTSVSTSQVDEEHNHQSSSPSSSALSYRVNISISNVAPTEITDDVWSCLVVLLTFWFFGMHFFCFRSLLLLLFVFCYDLIEF